MGGYQDRQLSPGVFEVAVNGNGYTGRWKLQGYFHQRASELCIAAGYTHYRFQLEDEARDFQTPSDIQVTRTGRDTFSATEVGGATYRKHALFGTVWCMRQPAASQS
jgi:hypothetical protein